MNRFTLVPSPRRVALLLLERVVFLAATGCGARAGLDPDSQGGAAEAADPDSPRRDDPCAIDVATLFPRSGTLGSLDGSLTTAPCEPADDVACGLRGWTNDGLTQACSDGSGAFQLDYAVGGVPGTEYRARLRFHGIVALASYGAAVVRDSDRFPANVDSGADPPPFGTAIDDLSAPENDATTYELHVLDERMNELRTHVLNSGAVDASVTYVLDFERTIPVCGGGRVRLRLQDRDCSIAKNCGPDPGRPCANAARTVDISGVEPKPTWFEQPGLGADAEDAGQWLLIDVLGVSCAP